MARRVEGAWQEAPRFDDESVSASLYYWATYCDPQRVRDYFQALLADKPAAALDLIKGFLGRTWISTGIPIHSDFNREQFNSIATMGDADRVAAALLHLYGDEIGVGDFYADRDRPHDERLAHQFVFIHTKVSHEHAAAIESLVPNDADALAAAGADDGPRGEAAAADDGPRSPGPGESEGLP